MQLAWLAFAAAALVVPGCRRGLDENVAARPAEARSVGSLTATASTNKSHLRKREPVESTIAGDRVSRFSGGRKLSAQLESSPFRFTEVAHDWGIDFVHFSGMTDEKLFPTANGSGAAAFDYDGDARLDIYLLTQTTFPVGTEEHGPNRLFRNLGGGRFEDVTARSGLGYRGFCNGVVSGDLDNDGDQDVFLCNLGANRLYRNNGDGTFLDVSARAGIDRPSWSTGGAMLDYDNDGDLDVYVADYGRWNYPEDHVQVGDADRKIWLYASPRTVRTVKHVLYRNNGDMTFTDVFDQAITVETDHKRTPRPREDGHGFGVVAADLNDDGLIDLYVANDMNPNFLFLNRGDGTFDDATEVSGAAFDADGAALSGMGVDAEDVDGDGLPELFVTNFAEEPDTLYQNYGRGGFMDVTPFFGLASDTRPFVSWGTALVDFDADGWPDLFIANGHVDDNRRLLGQPIDYEEPALLFRNVDGRRFRLATRDAGAYFDRPHVGRGAAFGDLDNDGDVDIVVNEKDRPAAILRNDTPTKNRWIRLALRGTRSNRDAIGSLAIVETPRRTIYRQLKGGVSMESANDLRLTIGVGADPIDRLRLVWPSGIVTTLTKPELNRQHQLVEPADQPVAMPYGQPRIKRVPASSKTGR